MTKRDEEKQREATTYVVQETFGKRAHTYLIQKLVMGVEVDTYHVMVKLVGSNGVDTDSLWCDCPGFRRQTYDKAKHKHILLVLDYLEHGSPRTATYTIAGTGRKAKIRFIRGDNGQ